jgi:(R,R)-butanediol dehydrogenase/meso-butanediol dehydrogenase/diacetyl reductase
MKSVRLHDKLDIRFENVDMAPLPVKGEVRVKVAFAGICGSDIHNFKTGQWISRKPSIAGHEFSGWVESLGEGVTDLTLGDKVVADSRYYCGTCKNCQSDASHLCENLGFVGEAIDGGFADFITLPANLLIKCKPNSRLDVLALAEPLAVALHAINQLNIGYNQPLLVVGCGPIGALTALASKCQSKRPVLVSDLNKERVGLVSKMAGATPVELSEFDQFKNGSEKPVRHVLDTTGNIDAISDLIANLSGCKLGLVGIGSGTISIDPVHLVERELSLIGCHAFTDELSNAVDLLQQNPDQFQPVIGSMISLEETPMAYQNIVDGHTTGIKTLLSISQEGSVS